MSSKTTAQVITDLAKEAYEASREKGWYAETDAIRAVRKAGQRITGLGDLFTKFIDRHTVNDVPVFTKLSLVHTEVSEAIQLLRGLAPGDPRITTDVIENDKLVGLPSELADIIIRTLELAAALDIDIGEAIRRKMVWNSSRSFRHGDKRC